MQNYTSRNVGEPKNRFSKRAKGGIALLVVSVFLLLCIVLNFLPFIRSFVLGAFGLSAYPVLVVSALVGVIMLNKKKYALAKNYIISLCVLYFLLICTLQVALTPINTNGFGAYLSTVYATKVTAGGVVAGIFAYILGTLFNYVGSYIILAIGAIVCGAFMVDYFLKMRDYKKINTRAISYPVEKEKYLAQEAPNAVLAQGKTKKRQSFAEKFKKHEDVTIGLDANKEKELVTVDRTQNASENDKMAEQVFGTDYDEVLGEKQEKPQKSENAVTLEEFINQAKQNAFENFKTYEQKPQNATVTRNSTEYENSSQEIKPKFETNLNLEPFESTTEHMEVEQDKEPSDSILDNLNKMINEVPPTVAPPIDFDKGLSSEVKPKQHEPKMTQLEMQQTKPTPNPTTTYKRPSPYVRPPLEFLTTESSKLGGSEAEYKEKAQILEETLESFKISANVVGITSGPAVTRYEIQMPAGISVKKVSQHSDDIAMMLQSYSGVRIEAPIPGKNLVGIEVPNEKIATIGLKDIIGSPEFHNSKSPLTVALGKDIAGTVKICDLASMPHLLVAGSTGSGKSVCLNVILISLIYRLGMDDLRLILIDPKRVEFSSYNGLPQLLTPEAICQPKQALNAFDWAIDEMNNRFDTFQRLRVKDINEYNSLEAVYKGKEPKLPRIVIVVDELADLMMMARKDLEEKIMRIAQLSRAAGIHLILATQRPSVNVITGTIKANLPSRIAFAVNNFADSNTIINQGGAEKLLGRGDSLYAPQNLPEPVRIQCPFVSNSEVLKIVDFIKNNNETDFDPERTERILEGKSKNDGGTGADGDGGMEFDPILPKALLDFIRAGTGSISAIQRRYSVGYARAARIIDQMEQSHFISPMDGSNKNRTILIDEEKYNELFSNE